MSDYRVSRRGFLQTAGTIGGGAWLKLAAPALASITQAACSAKDKQSPFAILGDDEAADIAAIAARIIPTTDTPGANEAGVIHFFDQAFATHMSTSLEFARAGLAALNAELGQRFAELADAEQDSALKNIENRPFFGLVYVMTIYGFFGMSSHGGNRDHLSWDLIGFKGHNGAWQYPFGYYDAQVHGGEGNG